MWMVADEEVRHDDSIHSCMCSCVAIFFCDMDCSKAVIDAVDVMTTKQNTKRGSAKMDLKVKEIVSFGGNSLTKNGSVNLSFEAGYSELASAVEALQMLNEDVSIKAKLPGEKAMQLGMFRLKQLVIDDDGCSKLKMNGLRDYVEFENINKLPLSTDETSEFQILLEAEVEEADMDDDE